MYEYVHCTGWIRNRILDHARRGAPLFELLEVISEKTEKRTMRSIKSIPLSTIGWKTAHETYFSSPKYTLSEQLHLAHRNESLQLCVFTNASDRF